MSYAVRSDGLGWRAVNGPDDCGIDETWQEERPPPVNIPISLQQEIDAKCRQYEIANELTLEGLMAGILGCALAQGITEPQLEAANLGYRAGKQLRIEIAAMRAAAQP